MNRYAIFFVFVLATLLSEAAAAQSIGVGAGTVKLENDNERSLFLTANLRVKLLGPIFLEPEVGYWKRTLSAGPAEATFEDASLGANGLVVISGHTLEVFGGAGMGAHFLDRSAGIAGLIRDSKTTDIAIHLLAGVDVRLSSSVNAFGVVRRDAFGSDSEARDQTKFYGGLRFKF